MQDGSWRQKVALFRMRVLGDLIQLAPRTPGLYEKLKEKSAIVYEIPGSTRTYIAPDTIRDWLRQYRAGGFDALFPKPRNDAGRPRSLPDELIDIILEIKEEHRDFTVPQVISDVRKNQEAFAGIPLPPSSIHRLLSRNGLMLPPPDNPTGNDRRRFEFEKAGDLWMSDVMYGPAVIVGKRKVKTYLIAFIDDATRIIPYAAFTLSENTESFLGVFKQALMRRGIPKRLYVDNGSAYRSLHLELVCAKLGVTLIHARAYQPQGKGKQERWFRTVRTQLLPLLTGQDLSSLEALNRRLWGYIEGEYHQSPHRSLKGCTPYDRWAMTADEVRYPGPDTDLDEIFLFEAKRKVQKDRTVSLDGTAYEIDASLVGETVMLRYNPASRRSLKVYFKNRYIHEAKPVDTYSNCFVKRNRPSQNLVPDSSPATPPTTTSVAPAAPRPGLRLADMPPAAEDPHRPDHNNDGNNPSGNKEVI